MDLEGQANVGMGAGQVGPPPESPQPTSQPTSLPEGNEPSAPPPSASTPSDLYEDTWMGQQFQVPKREATALMYMGTLLQNMLREEGQKKQAQAQAQAQEPAAPPQGAPQAGSQPPELRSALERMAALEKALEEDRATRNRERLIQDTEKAIGQHPFFENFKDETERRFILGLVANHYASDLRDPRISAKWVGDKLSAIMEKAKTNYLTGKVQQATKQPLGRGGAPATSQAKRTNLYDKATWEGAEALLNEFPLTTND